MALFRSSKEFNPNRSRKYLILGFAGVFAIIGGIVALLLTRAATIQIDTSLPQVRNVRTFVDDRVITVTWDAPTNAQAAGIVGYFIEYGETALGTFPYTKQTTYNMVQLQPIENNRQYSIKVYAAHGSSVMVNTPGAHDDNSAPEMRGSGRVSTPVMAVATPSSARVDQLRTQMTGFFDDFNLPAGPMDESKWNQAGSACGMPGSYGAFINNQHHAHNQVSTIAVDDEYCDRGQMATRARGVFDIAGRTEASPGEIVWDMDGVTRGRDVWYLDLIPTNVRTNGAPLDVTAHGSAFDDEASDPMGIRIIQAPFTDGVRVSYFGADKQPHEINASFSCGRYDNQTGANFHLCDASNKVAGMSPLTEPSRSFLPVPNARRHWRVQMTTTKMKIFIDSVRVLEVPIPAEFQSITKYQVHSTLFTYNTGKDDPDNPKTIFFHWDNFGFNGPASPTVVNNYIEGGSTGSTPYLGRGTLANRVPKFARTTLIPIPDQVGTPVKARLHFTMTSFGPGWYTYNSAHNIRINGNTYPFAHPRNQVPAPVWSVWNANDIGNGNNPMALSIDVNPAHLIRGNNQIQLNIDGHHQAIMNVHIELEYPRGSQPAYTSPTGIFGLAAVNNFYMPTLDDHDKYLFVEQNLGLTSATDGHEHPPTSCHDSTHSVVSIPRVEAENMYYCTPVVQGSDSNASGGSYIQF